VHENLNPSACFNESVTSPATASFTTAAKMQLTITIDFIGSLLPSRFPIPRAVRVGHTAKRYLPEPVRCVARVQFSALVQGLLWDFLKSQTNTSPHLKIVKSHVKRAIEPVLLPPEGRQDRLGKTPRGHAGGLRQVARRRFCLANAGSAG
jgi:hypothetical protein